MIFICRFANVRKLFNTSNFSASFFHKSTSFKVFNNLYVGKCIVIPTFYVISPRIVKIYIYYYKKAY